MSENQTTPSPDQSASSAREANITSTLEMLKQSRTGRSGKPTEYMDAPKVEAKPERVEPKAETAPKEAAKKEPESTKLEESKPNKMELELERLRKELKDTRKWANETNMKLKSKVEAGDIDVDIAKELTPNSVALEDNPFAAIHTRWQEDLERLRPIFEDNGEDIGLYHEAFLEWFKMLPQEEADAYAEEILSLPDSKWTAYMLKRGKEFSEDSYQEIKQHGSSIKAFKAAKEEVLSVKAELESLRAKYDALKEQVEEKSPNYTGRQPLRGMGHIPEANKPIEPERNLTTAEMIAMRHKARIGKR